MEKSKKTRKHNPHSWFWATIRKNADYDEADKDKFARGIVSHYSDGKTESLSELHAKYPKDYNRMKKEMKGEDVAEARRRQLIAALHQWAGAKDCKYSTDYLIGIVCHATGYRNFNKIPVSVLIGQIFEFNKQKDSIQSAKKSKELYFVNPN